ncbi:hypothetical protein EV426DRAFT_588196 [Tirmania nivea]|nr:hypothetical protein EV426DRAFT_588196 [Tirmania nivea]
MTEVKGNLVLADDQQCLVQMQPLINWSLLASEVVDIVTAEFYSPVVWMSPGLQSQQTLPLVVIGLTSKLFSISLAVLEGGSLLFVVSPSKSVGFVIDISEVCIRLRRTAALLCKGGVPGEDGGCEATAPILDNGAPRSANTRPQRCGEEISRYLRTLYHLHYEMPAATLGHYPLCRSRKISSSSGLISLSYSLSPLHCGYSNSLPRRRRNGPIV